MSRKSMLKSCRVIATVDGMPTLQADIASVDCKHRLQETN